MPQPTSARGRISGEDVNKYLETFASTFLAGKIQFGVEVRNIRRRSSGTGWHVEVYDRVTSRTESRIYRRAVLCTGVRDPIRLYALELECLTNWCPFTQGQSSPKFPPDLNPDAATAAGFKGMVFHSFDFGSRLRDLLASVPPIDPSSRSRTASVVVVGGGKSAQELVYIVPKEHIL